MKANEVNKVYKVYKACKVCKACFTCLDIALSAKSLRTGLFVVCFFVVMCAAAGCGKTGELLSELRDEETLAAGDEAQEGGEPGDAEEAAPDASEIGQTAVVLAEKARVSVEARKICVHVCGAVKSPGVYELPEGSRFYEAVEAAGGFAEEACEDYLNMAALLADGSRLEIPTIEEITAAKEAEKGEDISGKTVGKKTGETQENGTSSNRYYTLGNAEGEVLGGGGSADVSTELVNINTADVDELCKLPGVGEGRAKAIIEYRQKQGGFQKKEDIMQVSGIGEKMYARMEEYLTVE